MIKRKDCRLLTLIFFLVYNQILLLLYYKLSRPKRTFDQECTLKRYKEMFHSQLFMDGNGLIRPTFTTNPKCYRTNATGVNRFLPKDDFIDAECNTVKRFLKENETNYKDNYATSLYYLQTVNVISFSSDDKTALASLPGSGNTWVRHLLEEVTGIFTGSIYNSSWIRDTFKGENTTDHVIVVKTHRSATKLMPGRFGRAVLIVRDPFDTALSEFNREATQSKVGIVTEEGFSKSSFVGSLNEAVISWRNFYVNWLKLFPEPIFVLFYDKLISDFENSMSKLCMFLQTPITLKDLRCAVLRREGLFHRPPKPEYMSRSTLVDSKLEIQIANAKNVLIDMCMDPDNNQRIKSNL